MVISQAGPAVGINTGLRYCLAKHFTLHVIKNLFIQNKIIPSTHPITFGQICRSEASEWEFDSQEKETFIRAYLKKLVVHELSALMNIWIQKLDMVLTHILLSSCDVFYSIYYVLFGIIQNKKEIIKFYKNILIIKHPGNLISILQGYVFAKRNIM